MSPRTWAVPMSFHSLRGLYLSCIEHEPGVSILPHLPDLETLDLDFCCYCLDCPRNRQRPCTIIQFNQLPKLRALSISGAQEGNVICGGQSVGLQELEIMFSDGLSLNSLLTAAGLDLEEIRIYDCEFLWEGPMPHRIYPMLRHLSIVDSVSGLSAFQSAELPSSAQVSVHVHADDFKRVDGSPQLIDLLGSYKVDLWLSGAVDPHCLQDQASSLSQLASMRHVRLKGPNWLQAPRDHS
ncbi:hypothetical protein BDV12DRAFT_190648 [Aspergillus spectabilis]